ncbi:FAD binding domain-containing protein [Stagonosporopsis vannaccii]|nr:FAD binding domain-containing protein [Stagonosporopsis vannaccii]
MKTIAFLAALVAGTASQSTFEPTDFNITEALLANGVDVSALPELAPLVDRASTSGCSAACSSLGLIFGNNDVDSQNEAAYTSFVNSYWSGQQRDLVPRCVFKPSTPRDVSTAVLISRLTQCPFAVKSGGHSAVPGGSNIDGGITISFEKLDKISLSADKKTASFQPGHTWNDIYTALEQDQVIVVGGRVASVGVGGLTLGGGISYFSSQYGLACDNVLSYEVVTASGLVINVSQTSYPDLYWALRGGGNNFGIVTQFNVQAVPQGLMWGGARTYLEPSFPALLEAYYNLGINAKKDGKAHQILSFAWSGFPVASLELEYSEPNPNATVLAEYNAIPGAVADGTGIKSLAALAIALEGPASGAGLRQAFWTWTVKLDKDLATATKDIFFEEVLAVADAANLTAAVSLQVITEPILEKMTARGGNALGLSATDGPLMNGLVALRWSDAADDSRLNKFAAAVKDRTVAAAKAKGKDVPYLYMNYASPWQDPVASYGAANKARLQRISKKYDPTAVFERLQPGYFKLSGAPKSGSP